MARKEARPRRGCLGALVRGVAWLVVLTALVGGTGAAGVLWYYGRDLPKLNRIEDYRPPQASKILDAGGEILAIVGPERRTVVAFEDIPRVMIHAVIAAEDADFYRHKGLDYPGMVRALLALLRHGRITQGGSTITQQLVKTLVLSPERKLRRKVKEIILARRLESDLTKDEILHLYLNQIYLGHGTYGVEEASLYYFGHPAKELQLHEAALLAGLIQSPERLSPIRHPDAARARRSYVLREMVKCGYIDQATATRVDHMPLGASRHLPEFYGIAPEAVEQAKARIRTELGKDELERGGLRVHTTIVARMQAAARRAVERGLDAVDRRQHVASVRHPKPKAAARILEKQVSRRRGRAPRPGRVILGVVRSVAGQAYLLDLGGGYEGELPFDSLTRYLDPKKRRGKKRRARPAGELFRPGDLLRVMVLERSKDGPARLAPALGPEAALVAIDPETRGVLAMVGGDPRVPGRFNRAVNALRQPGSSFKPFVYIAALGLRRPDLTLATLIDDSPQVYIQVDGREWAPKNYDGKYRGPMRMREGLIHSVNMVAIKLMKEVGVSRVIELAHAMGIHSDLAPYLPLALGASGVRPIEMANAYATIAARGKAADPILVARVEGSRGQVLLEQEAEPVRVLDEDLACLATDMLGSVVQEGTGRRVRALGRPAAGKTGTTNRETDAWFVGFVPDIAAAVWVGHDDNHPLGRGEQGGKTAAPIWLDFMKAALEGTPVRDFPDCPGLVTRRIDKETGLLAPPGYDRDDTVVELFLPGTEPKEYVPTPGELGSEDFLLQQTGEALGEGERSDEDQPDMVDPLAPPPDHEPPKAPAGEPVYDEEDLPPTR